MSENRSNKIVYTAAILLMFIIIFIFSWTIDDKKFDKLVNEYPIVKNEDSISGIITDINYPSVGNRSPRTIYCTIDGNQVCISTYNYEIDESLGIKDIAIVGDSIFKSNGSDSLFLFDKYSKELKFVYQLRKVGN